MNPYNRTDPNVRMPNQIMVPRPRAPMSNNNPRLVYIANQNNFPPIQNTQTNVPVMQTQQSTNQNSITNKLCKFFKNLLELEKDQGRYDESVAIIQRYINKEINVDELGSQLKGNASRAPLPESLMTSLKSNIDDLRREMFFGRVKIDRINPPPENVIEMAPPSSSNALTLAPGGTLTTVATAPIARLPASQLVTQRPANLYVQQQQQQQQQGGTMIRQTQPNQTVIRQSLSSPAAVTATRQTRPIGNTVSVFAPQATLSISNASLRSIAPSSPIRPTIQSVSGGTIRTVAVPTSALAKSAPTIKVEDVANATVVPSVTEAHPAGTGTSISLPTNIVNHGNYRQKISETFQAVSISDEALHYISEAIENFSSSLMEQAAAFACHRQEMFATDPTYKKIDDVRAQMRYLQEYEEYQRTTEEERQKEELFKAAKSRSKVDNQEQQKIKETVRKIQEHDKNCDEYSRANKTALQAIGSKRKLFEAGGEEGGQVHGQLRRAPQAVGPLLGRPGGEYGGGGVGGTQVFLGPGLIAGRGQARSTAPAGRQRNKRIILKDFQLALDQDLRLKRFKTFRKIFMFGRY